MYHLALEEGAVNEQAPPPTKESKRKKQLFCSTNEQETHNGSCMKK